MNRPWFYDHYTQIRPHEWRWPNFQPWEMSDRKSGALLVVPAFMDWLQMIRNFYGRPMIVTSGYRTPEHQQLLPGFRTSGSHVDGMAVDIGVYGAHARELIEVACHHGVLGLGVSQTGDLRSRYLHLDMWDKAPAGTRPNIWSY